MRRPRFSLSVFLIAFGILSMLLGFVGMQIADARRQRHLIALIEEYGGESHHNLNFEDGSERSIRFSNLEFSPSLPGPHFVRRLLGDEYFVSVAEAFFDRQSHRVLDDAMFIEFVDALQSQGLPRPRGLVFCQLPITDVALEQLEHFPDLTSLHIVDCPGVTDAGLKHIQSLSKLRRLDLQGTSITDHGLSGLARLSELRELSLRKTAVTDAVLKHLEGLKEMEWLGLSDTSVSSMGRRALKSQLPHCEMTW